MSARLTVTRSGPPKKRRDNPEQRLAIAVADFLRVALPDDAVWWHTPNSIWTTVKQAGVHKAMGVKAGVADILLIYKGRPFAMELKSGTGSLSGAQHTWLSQFVRAGGAYCVVRNLDVVESLLIGWGIPLRATLNPGSGWRLAA